MSGTTSASTSTSTVPPSSTFPLFNRLWAQRFNHSIRTSSSFIVFNLHLACVQVCKLYCLQVFKCSKVIVFKCSSVQIHRVQVFNLHLVQVFYLFIYCVDANPLRERSWPSVCLVEVRQGSSRRKACSSVPYNSGVFYSQLLLHSVVTIG